nr:MAG TPA: hypothetical protein [Caudoviricetes sp.]
MDRTNSVLDTGTDRTKDRLCPCPRDKNNAPKRCTWTGQSRSQTPSLSKNGQPITLRGCN